jgi:hypothetical protein
VLSGAPETEPRAGAEAVLVDCGVGIEGSKKRAIAPPKAGLIVDSAAAAPDVAARFASPTVLRPTSVKGSSKGAGLGAALAGAGPERNFGLSTVSKSVGWYVPDIGRLVLIGWFVAVGFPIGLPRSLNSPSA